MIRCRPLFAVFLALTLMLGSVVGAVARSEMAGARTLDLCGANNSSVLLDAMGRPVPLRHNCPHCLAAGVAAVLPSPVRVLAPLTVAAVQRTTLVVTSHAKPALTPSARGPPI